MTHDGTAPIDSRRILHLDMDAFFASVEQRDDPSLRGRPVAVGGDPARRGVVAAASYEARRFGVRSAMPMAQAVRLCPTLLVVRPDFARYKAVSATVMHLFRDVTPLVEPLSLDEAYLDVTENRWHEPIATEVARRLKHAIRDTVGLTASAGVAPNKFLAKIASGWQKPDGLTVISPARVEPFLQQLPVDALWGVGPVTAARLRTLGVARLVDVRGCAPDTLRAAVGRLADTLQQLARGVDPRPVCASRIRKSIGQERTFADDLRDVTACADEVRRMAAHLGAWMATHGQTARTVTVKVRYGDYRTVSRQRSAPPMHDAEQIARYAIELLHETDATTRPVRLLGVSLHRLEPRDATRASTEAPTLPF